MDQLIWLLPMPNMLSSGNLFCDVSYRDKLHIDTTDIKVKIVGIRCKGFGSPMIVRLLVVGHTITLNASRQIEFRIPYYFISSVNHGLWRKLCSRLAGAMSPKTYFILSYRGFSGTFGLMQGQRVLSNVPRIIGVLGKLESWHDVEVVVPSCSNDVHIPQVTGTLLRSGYLGLKSKCVAKGQQWFACPRSYWKI
jgi:hypothetical protein